MDELEAYSFATPPVDDLPTRLALAAVAARLVWWEWDLAEDRLSVEGRDAGTATAWFEAMHADDVAAARRGLVACLTGRDPWWECEHRQRVVDGEWRWVRQVGRVVEREEDGRPRRVLGATQDVQARRLAEAEVGRLSQVISQVGAAVVITDARGRIEYVNPAFTRLTGHAAEEVNGRTTDFLFDAARSPRIDSALRKAARRGEGWAGEVGHRRKDGEFFETRLAVSPARDQAGRVTHFIAVADDITAERRAARERERLEAELARARASRALGTETSDIAHDFNNLLTTILGYADLAGIDLEEGHPARHALAEIERAGRRAADLAGRLLELGKRAPEPMASAADAGAFWPELAARARERMPAGVELVWRDASDGARFLPEKARLAEAVLELCANAGRAAAVGGKRVEVHVTCCGPDTPVPICRFGEIAPGPRLSVSVMDTGPGVPDDLRERIFEPYFTTWAGAAGLGLERVKNVVLAYGGGLEFESAQGRGCCFALHFPMHDTPLSLGNERGANGANPPPSRSRVVVVDDEPGVADLVGMALRQTGREASVFYGAKDFLDALRADPGIAQLVITDQSMPEISGLDLIRILRAEGWTMPTILASGYGVEVDEATHTAPGGVRFLAKPFELGTLLQLVDAALGVPVRA